MMRLRLPPALVVLIAGAVLTGCGGPASPPGVAAQSPSRSPSPSPSPSPSRSPSPGSRLRSIVALGDSVPRGTNCDCTPYPPLTAEAVSGTTGHAVTTVNDSVAGYTSSAVLRQLDRDRAVIKHVGGAGVVEIQVGANDVAHRDSCGTALSCYTADVPQVEKNLTAIVSRVHELTGGSPVLVVLLDYWSVWLGGSYAAAQGEAYVAAAQKLTDAINTAVRAVATASGSAYVDLRAAFKGRGYTRDESRYLSDDGDHPNAAGHQRIAQAAAHVIENELRPG